MTTKAPSPVKPAPEESLEKIAYGSVADIPIQDPHDRDRLGYTIWLWLKHRQDPLEIAVHTAQARLQISEDEAVSRIRAFLKARGVSI